MLDDDKSPAEAPEFNDPVDAIKFHMVQNDLNHRDLVPMIGSRSKVSEVLSGTRSLTMPMARALHRHLGIPAADLLIEPAVLPRASEKEIDWRRFPLREMAKRNWIEHRTNLGENAKELVTGLMRKAGCSQAAVALYRANNQNRTNAKTDPYALQAWCWQVMVQAKERELAADYRPDEDQVELMRQTARLSSAIDGPRQAIDFLGSHGIAVEVLRHLPRTHLDGAAMKSDGGHPVIGLTLRYDRIDNFWWVLMHELAHVALHLPATCEAFVDDDDLRSTGADDKELEADRLAYECLIPADVWENSGILQNPSPMSVIGIAQQVGIHPAIVAGRARLELGNYRLLSQFVGTREIRKIFPTWD